MARKKRAVLVLGMHRSGTSALTRVLNLMGLELSSDLIPPVPDDNETGYWESQEIVSIHNRLLDQIGSSWDDCLAISESLITSNEAKTAADEILEVLHRDFADAPGFVIKDPRICRLVPLWLEILRQFGAQAYLVLISRHPFEVAASLERRNAIPEAAAIHLWLRHVVDMERHSRTQPRALVTYDALLANWRQTVHKISSDLHIRWPRQPVKARNEVEGYLCDGLRHHELSGPPPSRGLPKIYGLVAQTYAAYLKSVDDDRASDAVFDRISTQLQKAETLLGPTLAVTKNSLYDQVQILLENHRRDATVYEAEIAKILKLLEEFDSKIYQQRDQLDDLVNERDRLIEDSKRAAATYESELAKIRKILEDTDAKVCERQSALEDVIAERDRLEQARQGEIGALQTRIRQQEAQVEESRRSLLGAREELARQADENAAVHSTFEEQQQNHQVEVEQASADLESLRRERRQLTRDLEAATTRASALQEDLTDLRRQLTRDLEAATTRASALQEELSDLRRQASRDRQAAEKRAVALEETLTDLRRQASRDRQAAYERTATVQESLASLRRDTTELEDKLRDTERDKDWLWERWNEAKSELAAPRESKIGRIVLWQWDSYLKMRHGAVRMKAALTASGNDDPTKIGPGKTGRAVRRVCGPVGKLLGRLTRGVTQSAGWIYLYFAVNWERLKAWGRRARKPQLPEAHIARDRPPTARLPRVLLVSPYPIYPANHGGGVRLFNLIPRLADDCEMHLLIFGIGDEDPAQRQALEPWARSIHFHHWQPQFDPGWMYLRPPNAGLFGSHRAARKIAHLLADHSIDILQLEYTELGQYGLPDFARVKVVLTEHDLAFHQHGRRRKMGFHHRFPEGNAYGSTYGDLLRLTRYELSVCRRADQVHVMSVDDGQSLSAYMADSWDRIRVVPNAVDTGFYDPTDVDRAREHVLYVGNFQNLPNVDALEYLATQIWPRVRARRPAAELTVVGAHPSPRITRFDGQDGIRVVGPVPDLRAYYHSHRLMVAPIRAGSGTRLKILEAFAAGLPVVSTTLGAEGIAAMDGEHLLLADDAEVFATNVDRLLEDQTIGRQLADNALHLARERYDWQRSVEATLAGWEELICKPSPPSSLDSAVHPAAAETPVASPHESLAVERSTAISIVIPTLRGGDKLALCLDAISRQQIDLSFEILCVDSGSSDSELQTMRSYGARIISIDQSEFDHGLTRDLGAQHSHGEVLVFVNQDAIPEDRHWLDRLTRPLFTDESCAAVQGGIVETPDPDERFYWDSCGERFYFTRESDRWIERYFGIGFSTVNAAIRRRVWEHYPFGRAPIMEDKLWQRQIVDSGQVIREESVASVTHTHNYRLRSLWRRCLSEGFGWRLVGERYSFLDMIRDGLRFGVHRDLLRGLASGRVRNSAEFLFPWLRPVALYWGNHWSRGVKL